MAKQPFTSKKFYFNFVLFALSVIFSFLLLEMFCRIFWDKYWPSPTNLHIFDPVLGWYHRDNYVQELKGSCFKGEIFTNEHGMVNTPSLSDGNGDVSGLKIALVGDSFIRGAEALYEGDLASFLRGFIRECIILNFGVSGYGTTQAFLTYKTRVFSFKPDVVVLGFLPHNDVDDNHPCIGIPKPAPYAKVGKDGIEIVYPSNPISKLFYGVHSKLIKESALYSTIYNILHRHGLYYFDDNNRGNEPDQTDCKENPWPNRRSSLGVFRSNPDPVWEHAWEVTEALLIAFKKAVEEDGGEFILLIMAGPSEIDPLFKDKLREDKISLPGDFDLAYPTKRLMAFSKRNGIRAIALLPKFNRYKIKFDLETPYFSYRCNGHWNPLGHYLAANNLVHYMVSESILDIQSVGEQYQKEILSGEVLKAPVEILGRKGFEQIYHNGTFLGVAEIK